MAALYHFSNVFLFLFLRTVMSHAYPLYCDSMTLLLDARTELWSGPSRHLSEPAHDAWREADARQVKVGPWHEARGWDEHVRGVGELSVLLNSEWQR